MFHALFVLPGLYLKFFEVVSQKFFESIAQIFDFIL